MWEDLLTGPVAAPYAQLSHVVELNKRVMQLRRSLGYMTATLEADTPLTPLQTASVHLIPNASGMAVSIAELIKGGFLVPAMVLFRPLVERVATLAYLEAHEEAIALWRAGWPHRQRPSLRRRLECLVPGATPAIADNFVKSVTRYNSLVHGDPIAGEQSLPQRIRDGGPPWAIERDLTSPQRARAIALDSDIAVVFLIVMLDRIFGQGVTTPRPFTDR